LESALKATTYSRGQSTSRRRPTRADSPPGTAGESRENALETVGIALVESSYSIAVDIEHGGQLALPIPYRNYNLGTRFRITGNVTGKLVDILDHDGPALRCGRSADPPSESDLQTAERSLVRPNPQKSALLDYSIKPGPQMAKRVMNKRADGRHFGNRIIYAGEHEFDVLRELLVCDSSIRRAEIERDFSHPITTELDWPSGQYV
jgi:hypothetical protein